VSVSTWHSERALHNLSAVGRQCGTYESPVQRFRCSVECPQRSGLNREWWRLRTGDQSQGSDLLRVRGCHTHGAVGGVVKTDRITPTTLCLLEPRTQKPLCGEWWGLEQGIRVRAATCSYYYGSERLPQNTVL
jgi:hypothetical protein